jgi:hypothetical protein
VTGDGVPDLVAGEQDSTVLVYLSGGLAGGPLAVALPTEFLFAVAGAGDLDRDGVGDVVVGARIDPGGDSGGPVGVEPRRVLVLLGGGGTLQPAVVGDGVGEDGDWFGGAVAGVGDVTGDGVGDVLVTDYSSGNGATGGRAYLYHGELPLPDVPERTWAANDPLCYLGTEVVAAGDVTGDGCPDFAFASTSVPWVVGSGRVWVVYGWCDEEPLPPVAPDTADTGDPPVSTSEDTGGSPDTPADSGVGKGDPCACGGRGASGAWVAVVGLLAAAGRRSGRGLEDPSPASTPPAPCAGALRTSATVRPSDRSPSKLGPHAIHQGATSTHTPRVHGSSGRSSAVPSRTRTS